MSAALIVLSPGTLWAIQDTPKFLACEREILKECVERQLTTTYGVQLSVYCSLSISLTPC